MSRFSGRRIRTLALALAIFMAVALAMPAAALADWTGGHDVVGAPGAAKTWYFAEGTTRPGFEEWLCIANTNQQTVTAALSYMPTNGQGIVKSYQLPPTSRTTVDVRMDVPAGIDLSVAVSANLPVVVERPMYFRYNGTVTGGHDVVGATEARKAWYFAEGTCRPGFDSYLCVQNPGPSQATVKITYMKGDGSTQVQGVAVPAHARSTVVVKNVLGEGNDPAHDFSCKVETTNGTQVVCERPMYFNYKGAWTGGHDAIGALAPSQTWYFAEGYTGS